MTFTSRVAEYLGLNRAETTSSAKRPPARGKAGFVSADGALTLASVYRAVQVLVTAASQLSIDAHRPAGPIDPAPSILRRPNLDVSRSAFIGQTVASLALAGDAFWRVTRGSENAPLELEVLDPHKVRVWETDSGRVRYAYGTTEDYTRNDVSHLQLTRRAGRLRGLGPIQAAMADLAGAMDLRDYAADWFSTSGVPSGTLNTDQNLSPDQIDAWKERWTATHDGGVRVLGQGLKYETVALKPEEAQFLEARKYSVTEVARLMGIPSSLMLAPVDGTSTTYQNVEQEWIGFVRFTLMAYLREIEEALSNLLPRGTDARFNVEALLRTDTATRYNAHKTALDAGFLTVDEVRAIEGLPTLTQPVTAPKETPVA